MNVTREICSLAARRSWSEARSNLGAQKNEELRMRFVKIASPTKKTSSRNQNESASKRI
jgi:hypothetical protein